MTEPTQTVNPNSTEDRFQSLYDRGAFEPPKPVTAEPAPEPTPEPVAAEPEAPKEEEPAEYVNVEDYLAKSKIDRDSFFSLPIRVKADGKEIDVPLADLVKNYGLEKHVQNKSIALSEAQRAWEAEQAQAKANWEKQLTEAKSLGTLARQQLLSQYQSIDWNKLRAEDPAQWAVLNTEFNNRAAQIDAHLAQVQAKEAEAAEIARKAQLDLIPKERERMLDAHPEWRDEKAFSAARSAMSTYAKSRGFTEAEIGSIFDHRYMSVLHDAAQYAALQAQSPAKLKQVRAAPVSASPGARMAKDPTQVLRAQAKEQFLKHRNDPEAQAKYFETLS